MFIFQHISSFISLIHPLSAVFISEETECRTFVIENKSISFSIFNYQFLIIKSMALNYSVSLRTNPIKKDEPAKAYATAQINGELSLKQLSRRVSMQTTVSPGGCGGGIDLHCREPARCPPRGETGGFRRTG